MSEPVEIFLKPHRQWDHMVKDGFIEEWLFRHIHVAIGGNITSLAGFALHNPRATIRRTISDRSKIQLTLNTLLQPEHTSAIITPHYRKALQDFFQKMKDAP